MARFGKKKDKHNSNRVIITNKNTNHKKRDSARQAENMGNYCLKIKNEINRLENLQDKMLDKLTMEKNDGSSKSSYS